MVRQEEEHLHNYLEDYQTDAFADRHMLEPIVFDWSKVSRLDPIERMEEYDGSDRQAEALRRGLRLQKVHVCCPRHGHFNQLMFDPLIDDDLRCDRCIDEEIDRIIRLRAKRDWEWIRERRRGAR